MATREKIDLSTPRGRGRAWRELMLGDHHVLRLVYKNVHALTPGKMWRSYQPSPRDLERWAKKKRIRTVVNLRGGTDAGHYVLEEEACAKLGLSLVDFRVYSREAPSKEMLHAARKLFATIEYPAMMHCKSGADRAGLMAALYLFMAELKPWDEAMRQLSLRYGHVRQGKTGIIDFALDGFAQWARREGKSLSVDEFFLWIDQVYDPVAAKKDFIAAWWGTILTDKILRRE